MEEPIARPNETKNSLGQPDSKDRNLEPKMDNAASANAQNATWRRVQTSSHGPNESKTRRFVVVLTLLFVGGVGTAAGLLSLLEPTPATYVLPIWVTHSVHPNAGLQGPVLNDRLAIGSPELFPHVDRQAKANPSRSIILGQLRGLKSRRYNQPLMVYISAFAALDTDSKPFLISHNDDPTERANRLYLSDVLHEIKLADVKHKLLVLDVSWPFAIPSLGMFSDDISTEILNELDHNDDPNLICINSCSPGQTGSTILTPRRTTFGFFFEQALLGAADGYFDDIKNGRISVRELARYLTTRVDDYSLRTYAGRQTPVMRGTAPDFDLIAYSQNRLHSHKMSHDVEDTIPEWVISAWKMRDQFVDQNAWQKSPDFVRELENAILQSEMNWRRGEDPIHLSTRLESSLSQLVNDYYDGLQTLKTSISNDEALRHVKVPELASIAVKENEPADLAPTDDSVTNAATASEKRPAKPSEIVIAGGEFGLSRLEQLVSDLDTKKKITPIAGWPAVESKLIDEFVAGTASVESSVFVENLYQFVANAPALEPWQFVSVLKSLEHRELSPINAKAAVLRELAHFRQHAIPSDQLNESQVDSAATMKLTQRTLKLISDSERSLRRVETWNWLAGARSAADDQRYAVERIFWHPGYASPAELDSRIHEATENFTTVLAMEGRLDNSFRALDLAIWHLPQLINCASILTEKNAENQARTWKTAASLAGELNNLLSNPPSPSSSHIENCLVAPLQLARQVEQSTIAGLELVSLIHGLLGRYQTKPTNDLLQEAREQPLSPVCLARMIKHLETPFSDCDTRLELQQFALKSSAAQHEFALAAFRQPDISFSGELDQETISRFVQQSMARTEMRKRMQTGLARSLPHLNGFSVRCFEPQRIAIEKHSQHLASLFEKLARDSPLASTYQGLAQHYRTQSGGSHSAAIRVEDHSIDKNLSFLNRTSTHKIGFFQPAANRPFSNAAYLPNSDSTNKNARPQINVLPARSRDLSVTGILRADRSVLDLEMQVEPDANPLTLRTTHGLFVEFIEQGQRYLHRVELPGLANEHLVELLIGQTAENAVATDVIRLRPSSELQSISFFIRNPGRESRELNVAVEQHTAVVKVQPNQIRRVDFPGNPPQPNEPLPMIPNRIVVDIVDATTEERLIQRAIDIEVAAPHEYVEIVSSTFFPFDGGRNRLEVTLQASQPIIGPECNIEMILNPAKISGLRGVQGGRMQAVLPRDGSPVTLYAENLELSESTNESGIIEIAVDGVARTFALAANFARQGSPTTPTLIATPSIRIAASPVGLAGPNFPIVLESLNAPTGSQLKLDFIRQDEPHRPDKHFAFPSPRETRIGCAPDGEGNLKFSAAVNDWTIFLDATGLNGTRQLVVNQLLEGAAISRNTQTISLDDQAPHFVRFQNLPQRVASGSNQRLVVEAISELTGVTSVHLFLGEPEDNQIPPKSQLFNCVRRPSNGSNLWSAEIKIPKDPATLTLTAVVKNGADLTTFETRTVEVVPANDLNAGKIVGQIFESVRPQPALEVLLYDSTGQVVAKTFSRFDGRFEFENVQAGSYVVDTTKPANGRRGSLEFTVAAGQTTTGDISLQFR